MTTKIYGAYGSNMNLEQMSRRCPKAKVIGNGMLEGYKLTFRKYANIEPCKDSMVPIVLWEITEECEASLDRYEGFPKEYVKEELEIKTDGETIRAMIYIMTQEYASRVLEPSKEYYERIAKGYTDNGIDLKPLVRAYKECLEQIRQ